MKFFLLLIALVIGSAAPTPVAGQSSANPAPQDPNAQQARTLINQAIQALGGPAYLNLADMEQQGRTYTFYHGQSRGGGSPYWLFWKSPDKERIELTKHRDVIYVYNGDHGYEITFKGTRPEEAKDLKEFLQQREYSLEFVLRRWLKQPGVALFYEGKALAANKLSDQVTVTDAQDRSVTLYLDSETHLPVKKSYSLRDPQTRDLDEDAEIYDNYHLVQGINTPFTSLRQHNGDMVRQRFLNSVRYNQGLADSLFSANVTYNPAAKN